MKKTLKLGFSKQLYNISKSLNTSSNYVKNKLHAENQPPSLLNSEDRYEEDLKISICKMTLQYFELFL